MMTPAELHAELERWAAKPTDEIRPYGRFWINPKGKYFLVPPPDRDGLYSREILMDLIARHRLRPPVSKS